MTAATTPGPRTEDQSVDLHPPKHEVFDLDAMTNTDPKGCVRAVDDYREEPFGLYLARAVVGHPTIAYLESWLLPAQGIRVTDFRWHPGAERDQDFYVDVARIDRAGSRWTTEDHYLDVVVRTGRELEVLDTDELIAALGAGLIDPVTARTAVETAYRVVDGVAAHGYDLEKWLASTGVHLQWKRQARG